MHSLTWTRISSIRPTVISTADRPGRGLTRICDRPTSFIRRRYIIDPPRAGLCRSCVGELFNSIDLIPPTEPRNQFALPHVALLSSAPDLIAMSPTMHILRTAVNFNLHNLLQRCTRSPKSHELRAHSVYIMLCAFDCLHCRSVWLPTISFLPPPKKI